MTIALERVLVTATCNGLSALGSDQGLVVAILKADADVASLPGKIEGGDAMTGSPAADKLNDDVATDLAAAPLPGSVCPKFAFQTS